MVKIKFGTSKESEIVEDKLMQNSFEKIELIVRDAINKNIRETNRETTPMIIKAYRKNLLVLREIEEEYINYHNYMRIKNEKR